MSAQSINVDGPSIGFIVWDNVYQGTGFVLNDKRCVVTCAHVINIAKENFYVSGGLDNKKMIHRKLKLVKFLPEFDLALLESDEDLCNTPFVHEPSFDFTPNQHLFYLGYKVAQSDESIKAIEANQTQVSTFGKTFNQSTIIDFIDFKGVGVPGYSGGPIINNDNRVVAIMCQSRLVRGIKGGATEIYNRAYSILPLL